MGEVTAASFPRARYRLPDRRAHERLELRFDGQSFALGIGRFDDGALAEVFVSATKVGSGYDSLAIDCGILLSIALQSGADLAVIRRALSRDAAGKPHSLLGAVVDAMLKTT